MRARSGAANDGLCGVTTTIVLIHGGLRALCRYVCMYVRIVIAPYRSR